MKKKNLKNFYKNYISYLSKILKKIDTEKINTLENILEKARRNNNTIFLFGNGGSASTATTMANDLGFDILKKSTIDKPFKFLCLNDNTSLITAIANDESYDEVLINQLKIHYRKNDILVLLSASGNSKNLVKAAKWMKKNNGYVFSIIGFNGGILKKISNNFLHIPTKKGEYGHTEDTQLVINHILSYWFQKKYK